MKKNKLLIIILLLLCLVKLDVVDAENIYKEYKIGDVVTYNGMDFYVIENSDLKKDYVTLLKKTPLTVEEVNKYGIDSNGVNHVNRYTYKSVGTAYNSHGYGGMAYYTSETCGHPVPGSLDEISEGCSVDYRQSEIKYVVDAWSEAKLNTKDLKEDRLGYKVRLITYEELLNNLGFENNFYCTGACEYTGSIENVPGWLFGHYWYWTMSPEYDSNEYVWYLVINGLGTTGIDYTIYGNYEATIRPVVNLKKEPIGKIKKLTDKEYKIGDIVEYNNMLFYVIKDSTEKDTSVTLLKAEPLTVEEVNKYGIDSNGVNHVNRHANGSVGTAYDKNGYGEMQYYSSETCGYDDSKLAYNGGWISDGCKTDYGSSEVKYVVDAWALDKFSNGVLIEDTTGYSARLIMLEELLKNLGYGYDESGKIQNSINGDTPTWVYSSSYYWTMSPLEDLNDVIWGVDSDGSVHGSFGYVGNTQVIRPVVTLKKITEENSENTEIEKEEDIIKNEVIENNKKPNQIISVPDTLLQKPFVFVVLGVILIAISITIYILIRRKRELKKK